VRNKPPAKLATSLVTDGHWDIVRSCCRKEASFLLGLIAKFMAKLTIDVARQGHRILHLKVKIHDYVS
jgi:hypothetical protein